MDQLPNILGALVLAAVLWLVRTTQSMSQEVAVLQIQIREMIQPEISRIRDHIHDVRALGQSAVLTVAALDVRVTNTEQRVEQIESWDGHERRTGHDRRDGD